MVKNLKRTLAILLSFIMVLSSTIMAFADDEGMIAGSQAEPSTQIEETVEVESATTEETPVADESTQEPQVEVATEAATEATPVVKQEITSQPKDVSVYVNDEAEFAVEVEGEVKACQWQMAKTKEAAWTDLSRLQYGSSETLKIRALKKYDKRYFRCIVTFKDGTKAMSEGARLNIVEEDSYPAVSFAKNTSELRVSVEAEEGTFPAGTTMSVSKVRDAAIEDVVIEALGEDVQDMLAVDITFMNANGQEIQPKKEVKVSLTPIDALDENAEYSVVHVKEDAETEELVCDVLDDEKIDEIGADGAVFDADSFSTYALVWNGNLRTTVHLGTLADDNSFVELDTQTWTLDGSAEKIDLKASTKEALDALGYTYIGARYNASGSTTAGNELEVSTLTKQADGTWRTVERYNNNGRTLTRDLTLANNSHIYIFAEENGTAGYTPPTPSGSSVNPESVAPEFQKTVTPNSDGTYTIKLDITGHQAPLQSGQGANVIVALDTTKSMRYNMAGTDPGSYSATDTNSRMYAAKAALRTLVNTLKPGDGTGDTNLVNMAFVEFNSAGSIHSWGSGAGNWTSNQTTLNSYIDGLTPVTGSGTNWEVGLTTTETLLATIPNDDNLKNNATYVIYVTDGDPNKCTECNLSDYNFNAAAAAHAQDNANNVATLSYLYGVFCGTSAGADRLETMIGAAGGEETISAGSQSELEAAFERVGSIITSNLGSHDVNMDDGVPKLASIQHTVGGTATDFTYYKDDVVWTDAPEAEYNPNNGVVWDLSSVQKLGDNTKYSVEFTIWPSQESYDLIADLNNGLRHYEADYEDSITDAERAQITKNSDGTYTLKTNTHLTASYVNEANNQEYNLPNVPYTGKNMPLPVEPISVKKIWPQNMLDGYGAAAYRYVNPETGEVETRYATEIELTLKREESEYLKFKVSKDGPDGNPDTEDDNWIKDDLYVSVGFMTVKNGVVDIKEPGHDYQIVEPPEFLYYWDLISDVYHPMVINGKATVLIYDQTIKAADVAKGIYEIPANSGRFYKTSTSTDENTLEASNYRRSNLNLTKQVFGTDGETAVTDTESEFTYKVTVTDAYSTDGYVWFSAYQSGVGLITDPWVTGEGVVAQGDGYFYAPNGTELTMKIKAGWNVRFLNLYHGTTYSIEETGQGKYEFMNVVPSTQYTLLPSNANWYSIVENSTTGKITGTITEPNNNYYITYKNKLKPEFYVYHSGVAGDGNLETFQMADLPASGEFNLYERTTRGCLYGGYYLDYELKGTYADDGIKGTNGVIYSGMNTEKWADCEPQTLDGRKMKPEAGETYYIKEVPTYYLRNYHQINYVKDSGELMALYLISAIDDLNYDETGLTIKTTDNKTSNVCSKMTFKNAATGKSVQLKANSVFRTIGITGTGSELDYLTYFDATKTDYFAVGNFTVLPFWKTLDGITVHGISTRTITISSMTKTGITKSDQ